MFALRALIALAMQTTTWVEISNSAITFCICVTARICIITSPATNATNVNASLETKEYEAIELIHMAATRDPSGAERATNSRRQLLGYGAKCATLG